MWHGVQRREKKKGRRAETVGDVMGDVADEFLDFLELGLPEEQRWEKKATDGSAAGEAQERAARARSTAERAADIAAAEAKAAADAARSRSADIDDELAALKRKLGL